MRSGRTAIGRSSVIGLWCASCSSAESRERAPVNRPVSHATLDANQAVASVAYRLSDVIAIYPITPASAMGEHADAWATDRQSNLWGSVPRVVEMQSEGGAAGALH